MSASLRVYFQPMLAATHPCSTSAKCLKHCGLAGTRHQPQSLFYQRETPRAGYSLDIPFPPTTLRRDCRLLAWPKGVWLLVWRVGGLQKPLRTLASGGAAPLSTVPTGQSLLYLIPPHCVSPVLPSSGHTPCSFIQAHQAAFHPPIKKVLQNHWTVKHH